MSQFEALFQTVSAHLKGLGLTPTLKRRPGVSRRTIERAEAQLGFPLPESVVEFYTQFSDGVSFYWNSPKTTNHIDHYYDLENHPTVNLEMFSFKDFVGSAGQITKCDLPEKNVVSQCNKTHADPLNSNYEFWIEFYQMGNGDSVCVDCRTGQIVYYSHEWTEKDLLGMGCVMGVDLQDFLNKFARHCFTIPKSYFFTWHMEDSTFNWQDEIFDERMRVNTGLDG